MEKKQNGVKIKIFVILMILPVFLACSINSPKKGNITRTSLAEPSSAAGTPLNFGFTVNFSSSEDGVNTYNTTAYHNYSADGYQASSSTPYPSEALLVSTNLLLADYFVTSVNLTVYAILPGTTTLRLLVSNNYFFSEVEVTNNTPTTLSSYGRQLAYKVVLVCYTTSETPVVQAIVLNSNGTKYEDTSFTYTAPDAIGCVNNAKVTLGQLNFMGGGSPITYGADLMFELTKVNATHDLLLGRIYLYIVGEDYLTNQHHYLTYDYNATINGVPLRFFGQMESVTPFCCSFGGLLSFQFYNMSVAHAECKGIGLSNSIAFRLWNGDGGQLSGTQVLAGTLCSEDCPGGIALTTEWFFVIIGVSVVATILATRRKISLNSAKLKS